jgi:hypothetical protein
MAFDSLQQCFRTDDIDSLFLQNPMTPLLNDDIFIVIDPAAGGPGSDYALVSFQHNRGNVTIVGIDVLSGCKEPSKQFFLVEEHIKKLRENLYRSGSKVTLFVERNLGFEAEHHKRALAHIPNTVFHEDEKAGRIGILTTDNVKHAAMELLNIMLREKRLAVCMHMHSRDKKGMLTRLQEQLEVYSFQYKQALNTFQKSRTALSGKVGGMKDDIAISLQLGVYWTSVGITELSRRQAM